MSSNQYTQPHRRHNPLTDEWVLVSPHRNQRPWQGQKESHDETPSVSYDENCYLCPGNVRVNGERNPNYKSTYVFDNDFPALLPQSEQGWQEDDGLFKAHSVNGKCRVVCFSPDHSKTLPQLTIAEIEEVVRVWMDECRSLGQDYDWVQVFENKGSAMGCSNPHPHGQIWASDFLPNQVAKAHDNQQRFFVTHDKNLLVEYAAREAKDGSRVVAETDNWLSVVPYWAAWPFETLVLPKHHVARITDLNEAQQCEFADILQQTTIRYDNLFNCSFPYSMGIHGAPFDGKDYPYWQMHVHFYPPLLRSATVRKFMVGYEMMAESQRDLTPEQAAEALQSVSSTHYKNNTQS